MITNVKLQNWRSHLDSNIEFSSGTNVLTGIMGSGKSSIMDAICFGLFGTFPNLQAKKLKLDDVIMSKPNVRNEATIVVNFTLDGNEYSVMRVIERNKGTTYAELRFGEKLLDSPQSQRITEQIQQLLKIDYELFSKAIYSEQNGLDYFLRLSRGERMKRIDNLLMIDRFEKARSSTVTLKNKMNERKLAKQSLVEQINLKELEKNISEVDSNLKEIQKSKSQLSVDYEELIRISDKTSKELKELETHERDLMENQLKKQDEITSEFSKTKSDLFYTDEKIRKHKKEIEEKTELMQQFKKLKEKHGEIPSETLKVERKNLEKTNSNIASIKTTLSSLEDLLDRITELTDKCPICETKIDGDKRQHLIKEREDKIKELSEQLENENLKKEKIEAKISTLEDIVDQFNSLSVELHDFEKIKDELKNLEKLQFDLQKSKENLEKELIAIKQEISKLRETERTKIEKVREEYEKLISEKSRLKTKIDGIEDLIHEKEKRKKELEERMNLGKKQIEEIDKLEKLVKDLSIFEKALENTQIQLREEFVSTVNHTMNEIWPDVYPYPDFSSIRLAIEEGDYVLQLQDRTGRWTDVEGIASGGERSISALVLRIAFSLVLAPQLKWLILDEPTHNLDSKAVEDLSETLRTKVGDFVEQVFIITHDRTLENAVTGELYRLHRDKEVDGVTVVERATEL